MDPDEDRQNVSPDLDSNCLQSSLTFIMVNYLKFLTLHSFSFKQIVGYQVCNSQNACQNSKLSFFLAYN